MKRLFRAAPVLLPLALWAPGALADSIDGDWCLNEGRHFAINGPTIETPGGRKVTGNYSRHAFDYVVPAPEANAGKTIQMVLMGEYAVRVTEPDGQTRVWRRCEAKTS
jgi:hypothetical protein